MIKALWIALFGTDNEFFKYNVREKMALVIIFILALCVIFKEVESETVKYVIVGLLAFLKGGSSQTQINDNIQQQIAKEQLQRTIIVNNEAVEPQKPVVSTGE